MIRKAATKQTHFDGDDLREFSIFNEEKKGLKYSDEEIGKLHEYMVDTDFTRQSPM